MAKAKFERGPEPVTTPSGLRIEEVDMPKSVKGQHNFRQDIMDGSTAKRVYAYDPKDSTKRRVAGRLIYAQYHKDEEGYNDYDRPKNNNTQRTGEFVEGKGRKGLVGYTDIYREPENWTRNEGQGTLSVTPGLTHVGYARVPNELRGGGIGAQMLDYVYNTSGKTPLYGDYSVNLGAIASRNVVNWKDKKNQERKDSVIGYSHGIMGR